MKNHITLTVFCVLFVLCGGILSVNHSEAENPPPAAGVKMIPSTFADVAETLTPAVVNISTTQKIPEAMDFPDMPQFPEGSPFQDFFEDFMDRRGMGVPSQPVTSLGSGFIVDAVNGYVITNYHVVRDAEEVRVTLFDDRTIPATIIGNDEKTDIAVLKIDAKDLKLTSVSFGNSDIIRVGDWILAIGNPFGLGGTVTTGIVSARARDINSGPYDDFLQTDASINRGNSGGPMFNLAGEVIGINTAIFSPSGGSVGIGFAIPSAIAEPVVKQIIQYGRTRRGWLGVQIQTVTDEIAESLGLEKPYGALVASVMKGGPAEKSGVKMGDIILSVNDQIVHEMKMLPRYVAAADIDSDARIKLWRDGKEILLNVKIGELEKAEEDGLIAEKASQSNAVPGNDVSADLIGLSLSAINPALRTRFGIPDGIKGVVITGVKPKSESAEKGLMDGEVIVEINQQPVSDPKSVIDIINTAKANGRKSILLLINRAGDVRFVALRIQQDG